MKSSKIKRGVIAVGILLLIMIAVNAMNSGGLPECDSPLAATLIVAKLNEKSQTGDEFKDLTQGAEISKTENTRTCTGITEGNYPARAMMDNRKNQFTLKILNTGSLDADISLAQ
jgi:hypothetical protein